MLHKAWNNKGEMPYCFPRSSIKFQGHTVQNITDFDPNWAFPDYRPVAAFKSLRFALFHPTLYNGCNHLSMLLSKSIHVTKEVPSALKTNIPTVSWSMSSWCMTMMGLKWYPWCTPVPWSWPHDPVLALSSLLSDNILLQGLLQVLTKQGRCWRLVKVNMLMVENLFGECKLICQ